MGMNLTCSPNLGPGNIQKIFLENGYVLDCLDPFLLIVVLIIDYSVAKLQSK